MIRIYAEHISEYMGILDELPDSMKDTIEKAEPCKRMIDPNSCDPRCSMGYDFLLNGKRQQKCRNNAFMFYLDSDSNPHIKSIIENEISLRE